MTSGGMTFTVLPAGTAHPAPPVEPVKLPRLGKVWKTQTGPGRWEAAQAVTEDGQWLFERADDGTWTGGHLPTRTVVKDRLRSLRAGRLYVASGDAQADLDRLQAHGRGEHDSQPAEACPECPSKRAA